ncbi:C-type lectin domain-containing protein 141-like [Cloeon dipterum]|uniref:C-type lectin domain-containing protein 141-like n=1 Tax=Cloeon dipterum TaxID=197152 RepID=UPI00321FADFC
MWTALLPSLIAMCTFNIETSAVIPSIVKVKFIRIRNTQQRRIFIEKCCADSISHCDLKNTTEYISTISATTKLNKNTPAVGMSSLVKETVTTEISSTALGTTATSTVATTALTSLSTSTTTTTPTTTTTTTTTTTPTTTTTTTTTTTKTTTTTTITTTTTTLPPCIPFTCQPNATKLDSKGLVDPKAVTNGFLKVACDRLYLFSVDKKTWAEAASECCSFGMSLITVESWQRLSCISDLMNSGDGSGLAGEYLTSLSDYQKEGTYIWCNGNNTVLGNLTWNSREPSGKSATGQEEDCGSITIGPGPVNSNVLSDIDCATVKQYICETPAVQTCNSYSCQNTSCTVDPVKRAQSIGWKDSSVGEFKSVCGRQYYLHRIPASLSKLARN